jgi:hypothetical protein
MNSHPLSTEMNFDLSKEVYYKLADISDMLEQNPNEKRRHSKFSDNP